MENFIANGWKSVLPEGWADRSMITLVGNIGASGVASNIVVTKEEFDAPVNIRDYAEIQKQGLMSQINDLVILDERELEFKNRPAYQLLQKFTVDNLSFQQAQTFVLGESAVYIITATAGIQDFNGLLPALRQFTEHFQLTNI